MNYSYIKKKSTQKIIENTNLCKKKGMIVASPSSNPPYRYHWIRDSALVMRVFLDNFRKTKDNKYFLFLLNYIENEYNIQNLKTISGLGEPKIEINGKPFNGEWGRPQNDGPALRGIMMINIYNCFSEYTSICQNILQKIILNDLNYIFDNYDKPCFDLWEEINGWHFYTRLVQFKFIKKFIKLNNDIKIYDNNEKLFLIYNDLIKKIKHHIQNDYIISSFDIEGNVCKTYDSSCLLAISHIEFDKDILDLVGINRFTNHCIELTNYFNSKYEKKTNLVGRYKNDKYYNGETWFICSLAICQFYFYLNNIIHECKENEYKKYINLLNFIISINSNLDLAEQYNPDKNIMLSALKLTWNYSELYLTCNFLC